MGEELKESNVICRNWILSQTNQMQKDFFEKV